MLNVIPITDLSSCELDVYVRLSENDLLSKHEPEKGIFIAESPNVIERALNAGCIPLSILIETDELARTPYPLTLMDSDSCNPDFSVPDFADTESNNDNCIYIYIITIIIIRFSIS